MLRVLNLKGKMTSKTAVLRSSTKNSGV